jgi:predicted DNA-binding protein
MDKLTMSLRITQKTRDRLESLKEETGLPFGVIVSIALRDFENPFTRGIKS